LITDTSFRYTPPVSGAGNILKNWLEYFCQRRREILFVLGLNILTWLMFVAHYLIQNHSIREYR
jgi:hypothetical protein